jgi:DNA-binding transcriptional regulator GbsR (MarR family)
MEATRHDLISRIGEAASRVGLGRTPARIYALLLMSEGPLSLDQMAESLGISKASVSVEVRELAALGAARKVWAPETRRDLYEAEGDLLKVVRRWARSGIARRVEETGAVLREAERFVADTEERGGAGMPRVRERVTAARALHDRLVGALRMLPMLLGDGKGDGGDPGFGPGLDAALPRGGAPGRGRERAGSGRRRRAPTVSAGPPTALGEAPAAAPEGAAPAKSPPSAGPAPAPPHAFDHEIVIEPSRGLASAPRSRRPGRASDRRPSPITPRTLCDQPGSIRIAQDRVHLQVHPLDSPRFRRCVEHLFGACRAKRATMRDSGYPSGSLLRRLARIPTKARNREV